MKNGNKLNNIMICPFCKSEVKDLIYEPCPFCGFYVGETPTIDYHDIEVLLRTINVIIRKANGDIIKLFIKNIDVWLTSPHNDKELNLEVNTYFKALKDIWKEKI